MTTSTIIETETRPNGSAVGERVELGCYRTDAGQDRVLWGQRIDGVVRITDVPRNGGGRAYLVERGLEEDGYGPLLAVVEDYLSRAATLGVPPMSTTVLG